MSGQEDLLRIPNRESRAQSVIDGTGEWRNTRESQAARFGDLGIGKVCGIGFLLETMFLLRVSHFKQTGVA